jgi:PPOX class probable F420-dependent enzyme
MLEVPTMPDAVAQFANAKYLNLETFRKTGAGVRTPVWFAQDQSSGVSDVAGPTERMAQVFYIYSAPDAGKVKRIRNNPKVRVAPCTVRGQLRGAWVEARARICANDEVLHGQVLLRRKYGWLKIIGDFFSQLRGRKQVVLAVEIS